TCSPLARITPASSPTIVGPPARSKVENSGGASSACAAAEDIANNPTTQANRYRFMESLLCERRTRPASFKADAVFMDSDADHGTRTVAFRCQAWALLDGGSLPEIVVNFHHRQAAGCVPARYVARKAGLCYLIRRDSHAHRTTFPMGPRIGTAGAGVRGC